MSNVGILTNKDKANFKEAVVIVNRNIEICKDGGWGWIVCISAALVRFFGAENIQSFWHSVHRVLERVWLG